MGPTPLQLINTFKIYLTGTVHINHNFCSDLNVNMSELANKLIDIFVSGQVNIIAITLKKTMLMLTQAVFNLKYFLFKKGKTTRLKSRSKIILFSKTLLKSSY